MFSPARLPRSQSIETVTRRWAASLGGREQTWTRRTAKFPADRFVDVGHPVFRVTGTRLEMTKNEDEDGTGTRL